MNDKNNCQCNMNYYFSAKMKWELCFKVLDLFYIKMKKGFVSWFIQEN